MWILEIFLNHLNSKDSLKGELTIEIYADNPIHGKLKEEVHELNMWYGKCYLKKIFKKSSLKGLHPRQQCHIPLIPVDI